MNAAHRVLGTWHRQISAYVALTEFARDRFAAGGLPKDRIHVRSNYVADPRARARSLNDPNARAIYVGRISSEKGVRILTEAWEDIDAKLDVYGDGPLLPELRKNSARNICFHGAVSRETAVRALRDAAFLVVPSICYESFPLVVLEAFSVGVPVLASRLGSLEEIVSHGTTGMHFAPGQPGALARAARELLANPSLRAALGANARLTYEERYTPDRAYARLMDIYDAAFRESRQRNLRGASPSAS
jgi:glycosyltransferase involved in cell wall biosynthesis